MIVGIGGTLGAGKGTVVEYLIAKEFKHYSGSGKLREILEERGVKVDRDAYSKLADEIRGEDPMGLSKIIWKQYESDSPKNAVFEALHEPAEAQFIRDKGGVVLGVDAPMEIRYERISGRGSEKDNVSFEDFKRLAIYEEEGGGTHNIRAVISMADHVIQNEGTLEELHEKIEQWLQSIEQN